MAKSNVWSEIRKASKETGGGNKNPWANLPIFEGEPPIDVPLPKVYTPVISNNELPEGSISFDIETGSVADMWRTGPSFLRLFGYAVDDYPVNNYEIPDYLLHDLASRDGWIIGHNIANFDSLLLDKHHGLSILQLAKEERLRDTKLIAFLADPPYSRMKEGEIEKMYSLQTVGTKYLGEGKMVDVATGQSVLKRLAAEFGGFDKIPLDHPEYNEYLKRDVEVTRDLVKVLPMNDYVIREHKIAAVAATISIQGFRVDLELLDQRIREGEEKRFRILTELQEYGLPGPETTKAPHRTNAGLAAIERAFSNLGIPLERTATGRPAMGKPVLEALIEKEVNNQKACDLAEAVMSLNGIRTIYGNAYDNLVGDRVHPSINLRQSSGRWSIARPGLTVVGRRSGKQRERDIYIADEGEVLIALDLKQIDQRAIAALCQDHNYLDLFEPGKDLHAEVAEQVFGDRSKRELAKVAVHGIPYGLGAKKLSLVTGMSVDDSAEFLASFDRRFPTLAQWKSKAREEGEASGILYNGYGRLMRIESERAYTQSVALLGQSTARDLLMEGLLRMWDRGGETIVRMLRAIVHDEAVASVPIKDVQEVGRLMQDSFTFPWAPVGGSRPVMVEADWDKKTSIHWGGLYADK